jgi:hypothetical protein
LVLILIAFLYIFNNYSNNGRYQIIKYEAMTVICDSRNGEVNIEKNGNVAEKTDSIWNKFYKIEY